MLKISQQHLRNQIFDSVSETVICWRICLLPRTAVNSGAPKKWKGPKRWNKHACQLMRIRASSRLTCGLAFVLSYTFLHFRAEPSRGNLSRLGAARPMLTLRCIPCFRAFPPFFGAPIFTAIVGNKQMHQEITVSRKLSKIWVLQMFLRNFQQITEIF